MWASPLREALKLSTPAEIDAVINEFTAFSRADVGKIVEIQDDRVTVAGVERRVLWGRGERQNCRGAILSVEPRHEGCVGVPGGSDGSSDGGSDGEGGGSCGSGATWEW